MAEHRDSNPMRTDVSSRRGFLGWMGRVGIVTIGGLAGVTATQDPAAADGRCNRRYGCCCLKRTNNCSGSGSGFTCPSGWTKRTWSCCSGGTTYGCGECQKGKQYPDLPASCFNGREYYCSKGWIYGNFC